MDNWNEFLDKILQSASYEQDVFVDGCKERHYFNQNSDVIAKRYQLNDDVYHYYLYQYEYDDKKRCISIKKYHDGSVTKLKRIRYREEQIEKIETYIAHDTSGESNEKSESSLKLDTIRFFTYEKDDRKEEKVCLASGDVSYYKVYDRDTHKISNPFRGKYAWKIYSIEENIVSIDVLEATFSCTVLEEIVELVKKEYPVCNWFIIDVFKTHCTEEESLLISQLIQKYERNDKIQIDFG